MLSPDVARLINIVSCRAVPPFELDALKAEKATHDLKWIKSRIENGFIPVTGDMSMISEHDLARMATALGGTIFLLDSRVANLNRWKLLAWFITNLPKMANEIDLGRRNGVIKVSYDGKFTSIRPSLESKRELAGSV